MKDARMSSNHKDLCLALLNSESEREVIEHLTTSGYWDNDNAWRYFGDNENNWSQIGNQQGHPVAAMVEKLVNSIDAVLMRECQAHGIPMESPEAPQSIPEALEEFFGIKNGNLANIGALQRSELARNIGFIATGAMGRSKQNPNYTVFDRGEGQTPHDMPGTLLSLSKSNKLRIPFVQGKFNMGGTGVLRHGGKHRLQLVISKRCPQIADSNDPTSPLWGFTIVRRQEPPEGARNSVFTYLAPFDEILMFDSDSLTMPNSQRYADSVPKIDWGTAIKLYEYNMKGMRSNIKLDFYYALSLKLPKPGLPVRLFEFRGFRQESPMATMSGLLVRLEDDRANNVEDGFPLSFPLHVMGEPLQISIYAFKKDSEDKRYRKDDGIVFTINGQTHGSLSKRFFSRQKVKMDYLRDSLLVIVDATKISASAREDLFMNSRDRLSEGDLRDTIEDNLERIIRDDPLLKALRETRRREAIDEKLGDSKPLKDIMNELIKKSESLVALLITGKELSNPYKSIAARINQESYKGEDYPTFFQLMKKYQKLNERPKNRKRVRFQFETDAVNEYFMREISPGSFDLQCNGETVRDYTGPNMLAGVATINIELPESVDVGEHINYLAIVTDETRIDPFYIPFELVVVAPVAQSNGNPGKRLPPVEEGDGDRTKPDALNIPNIREVYEPEWQTYDFDKLSALSVLNTGDDGYDFFINMDNLYLKTELKSLKVDEEPMLLQTRFKSAMVLMGMMILKEASNGNAFHDESEMTPPEAVAKFTKIVAPVILPMIDSLGDLDLD